MKKHYLAVALALTAVFAVAIPALGSGGSGHAGSAKKHRKKVKRGPAGPAGVAGPAGAQGPRGSTAPQSTSNASAIDLSAHTCATRLFSAPGVQPGDVVAISTDLGNAITGRYIVGYSSVTVPGAGSLNVEICADDAVSIPTGGLIINYVSFR